MKLEGRKTTMDRVIYLAAHDLMLAMVMDGRIGMECPWCLGTAAYLLVEDDVVVGARCPCGGGSNGLLFGREKEG